MTWASILLCKKFVQRSVLSVAIDETGKQKTMGKVVPYTDALRWRGVADSIAIGEPLHVGVQHTKRSTTNQPA